MNKTWQVDALGALVLFGLAALLYCAIIRPQLDQRAKFQTDQQACIAAQEKLNIIDESLTAIRAELATAQHQRTAEELPLQSASLLNHRLALITELASSAGATLDDIQPQKLEPGARFDLLPIHISGTGSYAAFAAMLDDLRHRCPDTGVGAFAVTQMSSANAVTGKFSVDISWYVQPTAPASK